MERKGKYCFVSKVTCCLLVPLNKQYFCDFTLIIFSLGELWSTTSYNYIQLSEQQTKMYVPSWTLRMFFSRYNIMQQILQMRETRKILSGNILSYIS